MNIFTYGTLMIPAVMYAATACHFRFQEAMLKGYARFKVKGASYPGITPQTDAVTKGIIYLKVDKQSLERLDAFEGELYQRIAVRVETKKSEILDAQAYIIKSEYQSLLSSKPWDLKEFIQNHLATFLTD